MLFRGHDVHRLIGGAVQFKTAAGGSHSGSVRSDLHGFMNPGFDGAVPGADHSGGVVGQASLVTGVHIEEQHTGIYHHVVARLRGVSDGGFRAGGEGIGGHPGGDVISCQRPAAFVQDHAGGERHPGVNVVLGS